MSYSFSKFPERVSKLFKPRPPLQYRRPIDYPPNERKTCNISPIANVLSSGALTRYMEDLPTGTDNKHLEKYDEIRNITATRANELDLVFAKWNPEEDENIKGTDPYRTIFVGRLPYSVDELELQKQFIKFGEIERVRVVRDKQTNQPKGYAFVVFKDVEGRKKAYREIGVHRGLLIKGRPVIVDIERGRTVKYFKPRRFGGGLGGRGYMQREKLHHLSLPMEPSFRRTGEGDRRPRFAPPPPTGRYQGRSTGYYGNGYHNSGNNHSYNKNSRFSNEGSTHIPSNSVAPQSVIVNRNIVSAQPAQPMTSYRSRRDRSNTSDKSREEPSMDY